MSRRPARIARAVDVSRIARAADVSQGRVCCSRCSGSTSDAGSAQTSLRVQARAPARQPPPAPASSSCPFRPLRTDQCKLAFCALVHNPPALRDSRPGVDVIKYSRRFRDLEAAMVCRSLRPAASRLMSTTRASQNPTDLLASQLARLADHPRAEFFANLARWTDVRAGAMPKVSVL